MNFSNRTMRTPRPPTLTRIPHLALIGNFWRVSPMPAWNVTDIGAQALWREAHRWAERMNRSRRYVA